MPNIKFYRSTRNIVFLFVLVLMLSLPMVASAQGGGMYQPQAGVHYLPAQSATLNIDFSTIWETAQEWIVALTPLFAIGIGISLAIGVLYLVRDTIVKSLRG